MAYGIAQDGGVGQGGLVVDFVRTFPFDGGRVGGNQRRQMTAGRGTHYGYFIRVNAELFRMGTDVTDAAADIQQGQREPVGRHTVLTNKGVHADGVEEFRISTAFMRRTGTISAAGADHHSGIGGLFQRRIKFQHRFFFAETRNGFPEFDNFHKYISCRGRFFLYYTISGPVCQGLLINCVQKSCDPILYGKAA